LAARRSQGGVQRPSKESLGEKIMQESPDAQNASQPSARILSIDALRGFDMLCIVGGMGFLSTILPLCGSAVDSVIHPQLEHAAWEGFRFCDLIFPLFVFLVGMTTVLSLDKAVAQHGKGAAYWRIIRRAAMLVLLGIFCSGGLSTRWPDIRLLGVLQRIGICYLFTGILYINFRPRTLFLVMAALLVGYWAWLSFVPVPELGKVSFEPGANWSNYIDSKYLPGKKYDGSWDPEGYLSTLPAVASCLLGVFAAIVLKGQRLSEIRKLGCLVGAGILCLALGYAWGLQFPIVKKIWTSSFVLVAGGYSFLLLAAFYAVIDVGKVRGWSIPLVWIGANAITIYVVRNVVNFGDIATRLVGGDVQAMFSPEVGRALVSGVSLALVFALMALLYRHKVFLRV
jgi:predicted acyltransferase